MKRIAHITTEYHAWATSSADPNRYQHLRQDSQPPPFLKVQSFPLQGGLELSMFDARQKVTRPSTWCFFWPNMFTKLSAGQNPLQPIPDQECHRAFVVLTCHPKTPHKNGVPPGPGGAELISNLVTSRLRGLALNQKPRRAESHCGSHQASAFIEPGDEL